MLRKSDDVTFEELKNFGFKYGTRDRFLYKVKQGGIESMIYINLLPSHSNNNELKIECSGHSVPEKIIDKIYDLIQAKVVEKSIRRKYNV